jgi:hypothetical protein
MKSLRFYFLALIMIFTSSSTFLIAQEETESPFSVGADFVSRYVWRGTDFGNAPAIQPGVSFSSGGFEIGAWGSYSLSSNTGGAEADLYLGYSLDNGLSFGLTDYYFPGEKLGISGTTDTSGVLDGNISPTRSGSYFSGESHAIEPLVSYEIGNLSLTAGYLAPVSDLGEGDIYLEAGYSFDNFSLFLGAGNGAYTADEDFMICNVGMSVEKEIKVTDSFAIPVFGQLILNPSAEQVHWVVGFSF